MKDVNIFIPRVDKNLLTENEKYPYKAEAVRINKADEQNRLITNQNKTQMKQWKSRISIFIKSVKGWVPFYPLLVTNRNRKFSTF